MVAALARQHLGLNLALQLAVTLLIKRQPQWQRGFEPFAAGLFRAQPDRFNHFAFLSSVNPLRASATLPAFSRDRPATAKQLARILAFITAQHANLIQQAAAPRFAPPAIAWACLLQNFPTTRCTHF